MSSDVRTTVARLGDLLASKPGVSMSVAEAAVELKRHRTGVNDAIVALTRAGAIMSGLHPDDRRRSVISMTPEQAAAWSADAGEAIAATWGLGLHVATGVAKAAVATSAGAQRRRSAPLRFAVWSDGGLVIDGLTRKQLTLPAADTGALAQTLATLPEGALQALSASPLRPAFALHVEGRDYPLDAQQTADLVAYIEDLPARTIKTLTNAGRFAGVQAPGTDHRVHRLETAEDRAN